MSLQDKAIDIKGKQYVLVKDRIIAFNEAYKDGSIETELLSQPDAKTVVIKATVIPEASKDRKFVGHSQAIVGGKGVNSEAALENAETSAVGRALAMMGIGVIDSVASADEVRKATPNYPKSTPNVQTYSTKPTDSQKLKIAELMKEKNVTKEVIQSWGYKRDDLTKLDATKIIDRLIALNNDVPTITVEDVPTDFKEEIPIHF